MGVLGDSTAAPFLRALLHDGHPDVRRRAALALKQITGYRSVVDLVILLDDPHHGVRFAVVDALIDLGNMAGETALLHWKDLGLPGKMSAIKLWRGLHFVPALPILEQLIRHRDWSLRASAIDALGALGSSQIRLDDALAHEQHPYVRARLETAMEALRVPQARD